MPKYTVTKPMRLKDDIGAAMKKRRKEIGLTMLMAADHAGLRESHWSTLESKTATRMSLVTADRVACALKIKMDDLFLDKK